jgi:1-deoxy-D-xylulose-5-phosphate reductoisomerase
MQKRPAKFHPSPSRRKICRIAILGSTGSIGSNALEVAGHLKNRFKVVGLAAGRNWEKLAQQAQAVKPRVVVLSDQSDSADGDLLRSRLKNRRIKVETGNDAVQHLAARSDVDMVIAAVVGAAGLKPVLAAVRCGKTVALANKEALVVAGSLVMPIAAKHGATIIPIDSEHSAVFQSLRSGRPSEIRRIILTASGGPFRDWPPESLAKATVREALNHPNWNMGPKITIDSATLMNKALELIEAHWLFGLPADKIDVLIHPQSIIHSMIEFVDGSIIAQLGTPDMRTAIQYAMTHPDRYDGCSNRLDWHKVKTMDFAPAMDRYPALNLGYEVIRRGGTSGAVLNAANEVANAEFRLGNIPFSRIVGIVADVLQTHLKSGFIPRPTLDQLLAADQWARQQATLAVE